MFTGKIKSVKVKMEEFVHKKAEAKAKLLDMGLHEYIAHLIKSDTANIITDEHQTTLDDIK